MDQPAVPPADHGPGAVTAWRAADFVERNAGDDIGLIEIAAAARIGPRALQIAFRTHYATTPLGYLREIRMERAHHDLLYADPRRDTVHAIAARWHFRNAGRFAVEFRRRFGRHPSAVLHGDRAATTAGPDVEVALLDTEGVILWVNRAWEEFGKEHGGDVSSVGPGRSYLAVCEAAAAEDPPSAAVATAIRTALAGGAPTPARVRMPCGTPDRTLMFDVLVSTRFGDDGGVLGATVTLTEVGG